MKPDFHSLPLPVSTGPDSLSRPDLAVGIFKQPRFSGALRFLKLLVVFVFSSVAHAIDFTYTTSGGTVTITGYTGAGGAVAIPGTIDALPVTNIGDFAFYNAISLTSVTIPSSVTGIGDFAFLGCSSMTTATLPGNIASIGEGAFNDCSKLTGTVIPNSVITIGPDAFRNCTALTGVSIGSGVTSIGNSAFTGCTNLTAFTVDAANTEYSSLAGVLFDEAQTLLIQYPARKTGSYSIPNSVTTIASFAFLKCASLTGITIPNSVTDIGDYAFLNCTGLTSVTIPDAVENIGYLAFSGCSALTGVSIGSGAVTIGDSAFYGCYNLSAITVAPANPAYSSPDGVLFDKNQTTLIQYPARKTGSYAVPGTVTGIAADAFDTCTSLTSVSIPASVTSIGQWAFYGCANLTSVTIPTGITSIDTGTFAECIKLNSVTISDNITSIGRSAFSGCIRVTGVTFGENVATIGDGAFSGCATLVRATFTGNAPVLRPEVFSGAASIFKVYYTTGSAGFTTPTWNGYPSVATTGAMPEIELEQPAGTPLTAGVSTSVFAPTPTNLTAVNTFTLRNTGTDILRDILVTKDGPNAAEFTVAVVPTTLAAGANVNFTITFKPTTIGMRTAQLHIASNDLNENPFVIQLSGEGTGPGIEVELLPENTQLADAASIVDYGQVVVNVPKVQTFSVRNSGTGTLSGLVIGKTGVQATDFTVSALGATTLPPGATTTFTVTFKPAVIGARNAAINIASNVVGTKNPFTVSLTGTGISPEIAVELEGGINLIDGNATALSYGSVLVGAQLVKTFTIRNTGTADLTGLTITQDGTNSADFTLITSPVAPVPPGGSTTFSVGFHPSANGARLAAIHIANNDLNENPFDIKLAGVGVGPDIAVAQPYNVNLTDGVSTVAYGSSVVGTGLDRLYVIRNTGTYNLTDLAITIDGAHSSDFLLTLGPTSPVLPGGYTTFTVTFKPTATGPRTAALHVTSNVIGAKNPFDLSLSGTGILPEISVEQPVGTILADGSSTSTFANTVVNATTVHTFTIRNLGTAALSGISITKEGANAADFTVSAVVASVGAGLSTTFTVTFKPSATGPRTAAIHIASNDPDENPFDIALSGTGTVPDIAVELLPDSTPLTDGISTVPYDSVAVTMTEVRTFTVRNTGTANLSGLLISKNGTHNAEFTVSALGATTLAPGATTTFTVSFKPTAVGLRTAAIHIASNVVGTKNPFSISLTGTGVTPEIAVELEGGINLIDGNATALSYGSVLVGTQTLKSFTIRNSGTTDLTGLTITRDGANSADFTIITSPVAPVPPGGSTTFTVEFNPSAVGTRVAAIHIASNDLNENPFDIKLAGVGIAPDIAVAQPYNVNLTDGVSTVAYGSSLVGTGLDRLYVIRNTGTYNLTDLAITIDGVHSSDFLLTLGPTNPVLPGGYTTFTVTFKPTATGPRTAALHVTSNVTGAKNPFDLSLTGTGIQPEISVEQPASTVLTDGLSVSSFANTVVNATSINTFTIRNLGTAPLSGITITKDGANAADFTVSAVVASVGVNLATTFTVTFKPSAAGPREATIRIASNDADENPFDVTLSGTGLAPDIAVELMPDNTSLADGTGTVPFGVVAVAATKVRTLTVRNTGTSTLSGLVISKTGTNNAEFTVSALGATTLAPGLTTTFTITFKPTALGARTAAINIANNVGGTKNPFTINLSGGLSDEARLAGLAISEGALSPAFASGVFAYAAEVANSTGSITVTPTVMQAGATVKVNGVTVASGSASAGIPLATGPNPITTVVTAPDGVTTLAYVLTVTTSADPYADWAESKNLTAGNSGLLDDPDHDGTLNLLEYAFDTDPLSGETGPLTLNGATITSHGTPFIAESPGPVFHAVFGRRADHIAAGLTYRVQFSTDMNAWTDSEVVPTVLADDGVIQAVSVPFPAGAKQFFRVLVTGPPN